MCKQASYMNHKNIENFMSTDISSPTVSQARFLLKHSKQVIFYPVGLIAMLKHRICMPDHAMSKIVFCLFFFFFLSSVGLSRRYHSTSLCINCSIL